MPQRSSVVEAPNPLREGLRIKHSPEPCVMVIFGATGDFKRNHCVQLIHSRLRADSDACGAGEDERSRDPIERELERVD